MTAIISKDGKYVLRDEVDDTSEPDMIDLGTWFYGADFGSNDHGYNIDDAIINELFDESTNITDINYNVFAFLGRRFNVANGTVLINGEKFDLSLDTYALSDTYSIYLSSRENSNIDYDDESGLEFTPDNEDLIEEIKEITDCTDVQLVNINYETYSEN